MTTKPPARIRTRAGISALTLLAAVCGSAALAAPAAFANTPAASGPVAAAPKLSADVSAKEAAQAAAETRRLIEVRAVTANAQLHATEGSSPYRLATGSSYTLVLPARKTAYTVSDLLTLAPQTFLRLTDGSYLLLENLYVGMGATLDLNTPNGLTLRMASNATGFVSIVSFDGEIDLSGSAKHPMTITSWDPQTDTPDTDPSDGRAYIRVIGGKFSMVHVNVNDLGFWSGATGGISLTGSDRPATGTATGGTTSIHVHAVHAHGKNRKTSSSSSSSSTVATPSGNLGASGVATLPAGALDGSGSQYNVSGLSYVSARIADSTVAGNAYGIYISSANGIEITDTKVTGSLIGGVVLHRSTSNGVLYNVTSDGNHGDGFSIERAAQDVQINDSTAEDNAGNGFTINGQPLADGPSASGEPVGAYGNNAVSESTAEDNGHYGVEILGGLNDSVGHDKIIGNTMGIVVRRGAEKISLIDNTLTDQQREGISVRDGDTAITVSGNTEQGAVTGVYVRDSTVDISGNTVKGAREHGVTLVGAVKGTRVADNVLSGAGPSPVSTSRESGAVAITHNTTSSWDNTTPMWTRIRRMARPMTLIWLGVFTLIALAGLKGRSARRRMKKQGKNPKAVFIGRHPYEQQMPLPARPAAELSATLGRLDDRTLEIVL